MRTIVITALLLLITPMAFCQGKGKGKGKGKGQPSEEVETPTVASGIETTLTAIEEGNITFLSPTTENTSEMGRGKGKGRRFRNTQSTGDTTTLPISETALITTATKARRTGDLLIGEELGGGIKNKLFANVSTQGVSVRLVVKKGQVVELNVLQAQSDAAEPIAVKPKRPPNKNAEL